MGWKKGDRIKGRYEIHRVLSGGMGEVYVAYDHEFREALAIKTFREEYLAEKAMLERFIREAEIWVRLDTHKNIVKAKYVLEMNGKPHIFLEYVPGGDLRSFMTAHRLSITQILEFGIDFCRGMGFAHRKLGIVHRDIKPENCMLTVDRVLKITDFGIAACHEAMGHSMEGFQFRKSANLTATGSFMGTIPYASPEQLRDTKSLDTRSDIYSFGIMLYEMLTGRTPFGSDNPYSTIYGHLSLDPSDPRKEREDIPGALAEIVLSCIAKVKEKRFADFAAVETALQELSGSDTPCPEPGEDRALSAWELLNKGVSLSALGMETEAIEYFDRALEVNPRYEKAWFNKGASLFALGRNDEAMHCNEKALEIDPRLVQAWVNRGVSLSGSGRKDEAIRCYDRALKINPADEDALLNKGLALHALGRYDEAVHHYDRALGINPHCIRAWSYKGITMSLLGKADESLRCCSRAIGMKPNDGELWYNKGLALSTLGRDAEALECYDRALEINPGYAAAWAFKGQSMSTLGNDRDAIDCYDRALELNPRFTPAWINKGLSYAILGDYQKAIFCYDEALKEQPGSASALANKSFSLAAIGKKREAGQCLRQLERIDKNLARQVKAKLEYR